MPRRMTTEEFVKKANEIYGNLYDYSKTDCESRDEKGRVCIICHKLDKNGNEHGEFWQRPHQHLIGMKCRKCANEVKGKICAKKLADTTAEFIEKAIKIHGDRYSYDNVNYVNSHTPVSITCKIHGDFMQSPTNHLLGKGCPKCANKNVTTEEFIEKARLVHGDKYDYSKVNYINAHTLIDIVCKEHGTFKQVPYVHLSGCGCQICNTSSISKPEKEIVDYIALLIGEDAVITNSRKMLDGQEIDIFIPSLKIAIEYDGLYWHSEANGKDRNYHLKKTELAESKGVRLIHIFEDEWLEHKEIVLNKIKHIIGKDDSTIIGARKCQIKTINNDVANVFLNDYHIQGCVNSTDYYGAYYNNELVGVMTFLKEKEGHWNMTRFATNFNYRLPGLANKLFKSFVVHNNPIEVKTFLDRRWGTLNGNVYDKMGFKLEEIEKPDYSYVRGHSRYHKFGFRKQTLHKKYGLPLSMTENEMTQKLGYQRIWNCGLYKYVWKNNNQ